MKASFSIRKIKNLDYAFITVQGGKDIEIVASYI